MNPKKVIFGVTLLVILGVVAGGIWMWLTTLSRWNEVMIEVPEINVSSDESGPMEVGIIARQSYWTIWYPGEDGEFGTRDIRLVTPENTPGLDSTEQKAHDDILIQGTFYLPVDQEVNLNIFSLDVLHAVYMPHFRVKMDAVPGMPTQFHFTPKITTEAMRLETENPEFDYELACAEICGRNHFSMRRTLRIVEELDYEDWLRKQPTVAQQFGW